MTSSSTSCPSPPCPSFSVPYYRCLHLDLCLYLKSEVGVVLMFEELGLESCAIHRTEVVGLCMLVEVTEDRSSDAIS